MGLAETSMPGAPTSSLSLGRIPAAAFDWRGRVVYGLVGKRDVIWCFSLSVFW